MVGGLHELNPSIYTDHILLYVILPIVLLFLLSLDWPELVSEMGEQIW